MPSRRRLPQDLRREASRMIQGSFSQTTRTCGSEGCACHRDPKKRHGPHLYLTFKGAEGRI